MSDNIEHRSFWQRYEDMKQRGEIIDYRFNEETQTLSLLLNPVPENIMVTIGFATDLTNPNEDFGD